MTGPKCIADDFLKKFLYILHREVVRFLISDFILSIHSGYMELGSITIFFDKEIQYHIKKI
jgi:hypothetical protein